MNPRIGSISSGTMRLEDLIPIFADELTSMDRHKDANFRQDVRRFLISDSAATGTFTLSIGETEPDWESDTAHEILGELFQRLDECAPPHVQFGSSEGDGADYGFWPTDFDSCNTVTLEDSHGLEGIFVDTECNLLVTSNDHGNITVQELGGTVVWTCV